MLKKVVIFSLVYFVFSFTYASIVDSGNRKHPKNEQQSCKKKDAGSLEENGEDYRQFLNKEEKRQPIAGEVKENVASKQEKSTIHSFNFLYYLIHHYKFADFITE